MFHIAFVLRSLESGLPRSGTNRKLYESAFRGELPGDSPQHLSVFQKRGSFGKSRVQVLFNLFMWAADKIPIDGVRKSQTLVVKITCSLNLVNFF